MTTSDPYADLECASPDGALISDCERYRYRLWRSWGDGCRGWAVFLMLNPSIADALADDPTIRKCVGFAKRWGMHGIRVVNLFALRSTDPRGLLVADGAISVGSDNDDHLRWVMGGAMGAAEQRVICAWGSPNGPGLLRTMTRLRAERVVRVAAELGVTPLCLGTSKDGSPRHPLMLAYDTPLVPWEVRP